MSSQLVGLLPYQLMLEVSGLEAGKFRIVQLPSILICEGETGLTRPSITPRRSATQSTDDCACAGVAVSSDTTQVNSRIPIQLWATLPLFLLPEVMYTLVPLIKRFRRYRDRGSHTVDWISAVPPSSGLGAL